MSRKDLESDAEAVFHVIRQLRPVSFRYKNNAESKYSRLGFIAQELEKTLPNLVYTESKDMLKYVRQQDLLAILSLGVQTLDSVLDQYQNRLTHFERRIESDFETLLGPQVESYEDLMVGLLA